MGQETGLQRTSGGEAGGEPGRALAPVRPGEPRRATLCKGCWDQMKVPIPIGRPFAVPFRVVGITRSKMNPNICTICERAFRRVKRTRHFTHEATILFSDIRGYTRLSEEIGAVELAELVSRFQEECAQSVWDHDGIVNKQMGDGLVAIFNFPIKSEEHTACAVRSALGIQRRCKQVLSDLAQRMDLPADQLGVGIGIHRGPVEIGEFSSSRSDFTAIGGVVNMAARLEGRAQPGEILLSPEAAAHAPGLIDDETTREVELKGFTQPVMASVVTGDEDYDDDAEPGAGASAR